MCLVGLGLWILLAFWSVRAFTRHIAELGDSDSMDYIGATAGEFALLAFILWHCFSKHINVRRWALIFAFTLGTVILVHAGALRGLKEARAEQSRTENTLTEKLTQMSNDQAKGLADANATKAGGVSQRERLALGRMTRQTQADVTKSAQDQLAKVITAGTEKVKESSILPKWYLDGWSYSVIFCLASLFVTVIFFLMMNTEDIDANFDGIPDKDQQPQNAPQIQPEPQAPLPVSAEEKPRGRGQGSQKLNGLDNERSHQ
jgi:hypothetical protein